MRSAPKGTGGWTILLGTGLAALTSSFVVALALVAFQLSPISPVDLLNPRDGAHTPGEVALPGLDSSRPQAPAPGTIGPALPTAPDAGVFPVAPAAPGPVASAPPSSDGGPGDGTPGGGPNGPGGGPNNPGGSNPPPDGGPRPGGPPPPPPPPEPEPVALAVTSSGAGFMMLSEGGRVGTTMLALQTEARGPAAECPLDPSGEEVTLSVSSSDSEVAVVTPDVIEYDSCNGLETVRVFPRDEGVAEVSFKAAAVEGAVIDTAPAGFTVSVTEDLPRNHGPEVTAPDDITVVASSEAGRTVGFTATASDKEDGELKPVCSPASGSLFPVGTTSVTCSATDSGGVTESESFRVTVDAPPSAPKSEQDDDEDDDEDDRTEGRGGDEGSQPEDDDEDDDEDDVKVLRKAADEAAHEAVNEDEPAEGQRQEPPDSEQSEEWSEDSDEDAGHPPAAQAPSPDEEEESEADVSPAPEAVEEETDAEAQEEAEAEPEGDEAAEAAVGADVPEGEDVDEASQGG